MSQNEAIIGSIYVPLCAGCVLGCHDGEVPYKWEITFKTSRCNCSVCHHRPMKRKDFDSRPKEE